MIKKLVYLYSKVMKKSFIPSIRSSSISKTAKVGYGSNIINVKMGKHSYMGNFNSVNNAEIGNFCSIASFCSIGGDAHPLHFVSTSPYFYENKSSFKDDKPVLIGNDVWIGEKVFVKGGISIGNGAVIGAHSVVTKDVPSYAIVAGVPATIINYRLDKKMRQKISESEWWNLSENELSRYYSLFQNPEDFIEKLKSDKERQEEN